MDNVKPGLSVGRLEAERVEAKMQPLYTGLAMLAKHDGLANGPPAGSHRAVRTSFPATAPASRTPRLYVPGRHSFQRGSFPEFQTSRKELAIQIHVDGLNADRGVRHAQETRRGELNLRLGGAGHQREPHR